MATPWKLRLCATLALILSFIFLPFWLTVILFTVFLFLFEYYAEGVLLFFLADLAFAVPLVRFHGFEYVLSLCALVLFLASLIIKPYILR